MNPFLCSRSRRPNHRLCSQKEMTKSKPAVSAPAAAESGHRKRISKTPGRVCCCRSSNNNNNKQRELTVEMPAEEELEEFFATAERDERRRFMNKYNYDVVKDAPVEGRYEWVLL